MIFKRQETDKFKEWLQTKGYDWNDPQLALGYIKLGQVDLQKSFDSVEFLNVYKQLVDCLNISRIELIGSENIATEYKYNLSHPTWKELQIEELRKGYESHSLR